MSQEDAATRVEKEIEAAMTNDQIYMSEIPKPIQVPRSYRLGKPDPCRNVEALVDIYILLTAKRCSIKHAVFTHVANKVLLFLKNKIKWF